MELYIGLTGGGGLDTGSPSVLCSLTNGGVGDSCTTRFVLGGLNGKSSPIWRKFLWSKRGCSILANMLEGIVSKNVRGACRWQFNQTEIHPSSRSTPTENLKQL